MAATGRGAAGRGLTQAAMAKRLGVSQAQVSRIEKQGYDAYTLNTLRKYVRALGKGGLPGSENQEASTVDGDRGRLCAPGENAVV